MLRNPLTRGAANAERALRATLRPANAYGGGQSPTGALNAGVNDPSTLAWVPYGRFGVTPFAEFRLGPARRKIRHG